MRTKTVMLLGTLSLAAAQDRLPISGEATAAVQKPGETDPSSGAAPAPQALAGVYIRAGQFERALETLERAAALDPSNKSTQHLLATCYLEQAMNPRLSAPDAQVYLERSAAAEDRALAVDPSFFDALAHKSRVLRELAARETRPANRQTLITEANALAARATSIAAGSPMSIPPGNESNPSFFPPAE